MAASGTFHLTQTEPTRRLASCGKARTIAIYSAGPADLVVKNRSNNVTLGARSRDDLVCEGPTALSLSGSGPDDHTNGTFELQTEEK